DWRESPFTRATQARREPGSAFKLFVFLAALEAGYRPDSTFVDGPISVGNWRPRNYEGGYMGEVSFRTAAARSINTVAVQLTEKVGRGRVIDMARRLGLSTDMMAVPSIALGALGVSLVELTGAYDTVANGGIAVEPYGIVSIKDRRGNLVYKRPAPRALRVLDTSIVAEANALLTGVIEGGTGRAAQLGRPAAGKTGTSSDFRDAMFMGYTADLTAGVWVGNDDASPMHKVTGGGLPAQIWKQFMTAALKDQPAKPLLVASPRPAGLFETLSSTAAAAPPRSIVPPVLQPTTPNDPARWNPSAANR
ncbi:MAG: transglycosylase domain-containing protein, partial [Ferrovibrionaceae bacterium]